MDRARQDLSEAEAALERGARRHGCAGRGEATRAVQEREVRSAQRHGEDQAGEIARLKAAL